MLDLRKEYPFITDIYDVFTNSDTYSQHQITVNKDAQIKKALEEAVAFSSNGDMFNAEDSLMDACCLNEYSGFIFGFTCALNLIKETQLTKK